MSQTSPASPAPVQAAVTHDDAAVVGQRESDSAALAVMETPDPQTATSTQPVVSTETSALSEASVQAVWDRAVGTLDDMRQTMAASVRLVQCAGPRSIRLVFPAEAALTMRRFEAADNRTALSNALADVTGHPVVLEMLADKPKVRPKQAETGPAKPSRMQRMREIEANPLVKSCVDVFGAEIVRIDRPK